MATRADCSARATQQQQSRFLPPDHDDVPRLMDELVAFVQTQAERLDPLILAGIFHKTVRSDPPICKR